MSPGGGMSPVRWGGGELTVGAAGEPPAALMDRPMVGPAQQGQIGQIGGAAVQPVAQMMGLAPGQRPLAVGEDTTPVTDGQGGALGGLDDSGGPPDLQRLGGGATKDRGSKAVAARSRAASPSIPLESRGSGGASPLGSWPGWCWPLGWRVTRTRVTAPSQASRWQASGSSGPAQPTSPPTASGRPSRLSRSTVTVSWGRTPPDWGSWPASRPGGPARPGHQRGVGHRAPRASTRPVP